MQTHDDQPKVNIWMGFEIRAGASRDDYSLPVKSLSQQSSASDSFPEPCWPLSSVTFLQNMARPIFGYRVTDSFQQQP